MKDFPKTAARAGLKLAPVPGTAAVAPESRPVTRDEFSNKAETAPRSFVAVAPQPDNATILLECIYTAHLIRKRHTGMRTGLLVHPSNIPLARASGAFDGVFPLDSDKSLRSEIQELHPDIVYSPDPYWRNQLATLFAGASVRIGGLRSRLISRFLRFHDMHAEADLRRLEARELRLSAEPLALADRLDLELPVSVPESPFVWLSLFEDHGVSGHWPVGHGARLARMLETAGFAAVIPLPTGEHGLAKEIDYLRRAAPSVHLLGQAGPTERAAGMGRAAAVVAPAGAETLLASMVGSPVVMLHDMRSYGRGRGLKLADAAPEAAGSERRGESVVMRWVESLERHLRPSVDECVTDCPACSFHSCMEYISPERVFENLKKVLLPF